ncbi:MAG: type II toxin-antitoxin system RelE/ParE family toxin [Bifidobacteriaceae bacterium]|nr:type II toxin-antitoxin system RelE/ParE family toxin [Bifidobacteriaceae bacterium]
MTYQVRLSRAAKRALTSSLPEAAATACYHFVYGPPAENPHRVGHALRPPLAPAYSARRGEYRVIYEVDEAAGTVYVLRLDHRRDVYHR